VIVLKSSIAIIICYYSKRQFNIKLTPALGRFID